MVSCDVFAPSVEERKTAFGRLNLEDISVFNNQKYGIFSLSVIVAIMFYMLAATAQAQEPLPIVIGEVECGNGGFDGELIRNALIEQMSAAGPVNGWTVYDQRQMQCRDENLPRIVVTYYYAEVIGGRNSNSSFSSPYVSGSGNWGSENLGGVLTLQAKIYGLNGQVYSPARQTAVAGERYPTYSSYYASSYYVSGGTSSYSNAQEVARFAINQQLAGVGVAKLVKGIADWRVTYRPRPVCPTTELDELSTPVPLPRGGFTQPTSCPTGKTMLYHHQRSLSPAQVRQLRKEKVLTLYYSQDGCSPQTMAQVRDFTITGNELKFYFAHPKVWIELDQ